MRLNTIKPAQGSKKNARRVGRGIGSGFGKTAGRGHKGQHSRAGGFHKVGFEGGQMPIQRRLPKRGFRSLSKPYNATIRTSELNKLDAGKVDLLTLKSANLIPEISLNAKIYLSGDVTQKDANEALKWYRKAADQGDEGAKQILIKNFPNSTSRETSSETTGSDRVDHPRKITKDISHADKSVATNQPDHYDALTLNDDTLLGISSDMPTEEIRTHLNKLFRKYSGRISHDDPKIAAKARGRLKKIGEARARHIGVY